MKRFIIPQRWERIIDLVEERGGATVEQIAQALEISAATVRRDLVHVSNRGLVSRTRGGAAPSPQVRTGHTLAESRKINPTEKELIGRAAAQLVRSGDTLMIDGGFTTYQVACQITASGITVVTNSVDVVQALAGRRDVTMVVIGGGLNVETGTIAGPMAAKQILQFGADRAILGADAISPKTGLSSPSALTVQTKKAMIGRSREVVVVADSTKLGRVALYEVAPLDVVGTLVTDDRADESVLEAFRAAGVHVIVASGVEGRELLTTGEGVSSGH